MDMTDPVEHARNVTTEAVRIPLTRASWLSLMGEATIRAHSSEQLIEENQLLGSLTAFHEMALHLERLNRQLAIVDEANLDQARSASRRMAETAARRRLFNIYDQPIARDADGADRSLVDALKVVGDHQNLEFVIPRKSVAADAEVGLTEILDATGARARRVKLNQEDRWWRSDSNAMLGFRKDDGQPVALLPSAFGGYREVNPVTKQTSRLNTKRAAQLSDEAWTFYTPLPSENVEPKDLLRVAFHGSSPDVVRLVIAGLPGGLIKLLPALVLGLVATHAVSGTGGNAFYLIAVALAGFGVIGALLHMYQSNGNDAVGRALRF